MLSDKSVQRGSIDVEKKKTRVVSNKKCSSSINQSVGRARGRDKRVSGHQGPAE
jgi:hypothetical protein